MCARSGSRPVPSYASSFIGREREIAHLQGLIADPDVRLITITGTAGVGKTRLATAIANTVDLPDVLFISLVSVRDPILVLPEIGRAMGTQSDDVATAIRDRLTDFRGLLVLDNFEQVIDASYEFANVIPRNPELTVILTSQRSLQLAGEHVVRLTPLAIPEPDIAESEILTSPSVQLLVQRASEQDSSFSESLRDATASQSVAEICRRLDGIPLALELAASRLNSLTPEVVLKQLEQDQSILSSQRRDVPERQRTMQSAIDWSFQLLPVETQRVFLWLGCFTGGFDLEIVESVARSLEVETPAVDILGELIDLSLVQRVSRGANPWYGMLDSMRQYCLAELDRSDERAAAESFVANVVLDIADRTEAALTGPESANWMHFLDRTFAVVRSSVEWALKHEEPMLPVRVSFGMWRFMEREGRWQELVAWVNQAMQWHEKLNKRDLIGGLLAKLTAMEDARDLESARQTAAEIEIYLKNAEVPDLHVLYLLRAGALEHDQQHLDVAEGLFTEAADLATHHGFHRDAAIALSNLGLLAFQRGDLEIAEEKISQTIALFRELGDTLGVVSSLSNLGAVMLHSDDIEQSRAYLEEAMESGRELGLTRDLIYVLLNYASLLSELYERNSQDPSNLNEAEAALIESITIARNISYPVLEAHGTVGLAKIHLLRKEYSRTSEYLQLTAELSSPNDSPRLYPAFGLVTAELLTALGQYKSAASITAKTLAFAEETEYAFEPQERIRFDNLIRVIEEDLPDPEGARSIGEQWSNEEFVRQLKLAARRSAGTSAYFMVTIPSKRDGNATFAELTPRENEVLELLVAGASTQNMAETLSLSPRTVTTHIGNMMAKPGVSSRTELMAKAIHKQG